jgi:hypothetical protein
MTIPGRLPDVRPEQMLAVITSFQRLSMPLNQLLPAAASFTQQHISSLEPAQVAAFLSALANVCLCQLLHDTLCARVHNGCP